MADKQKINFGEKDLYLFKHALEGDREAQSAFYKIIEPVIFNSAKSIMRRMFGRPDYDGINARQLCDTSFLKSLDQAVKYREKAAERMEHPDQFIGLYLKILKSVSIDELRAHGDKTRAGLDRTKLILFTELDKKQKGFCHLLEDRPGLTHSDREKTALIGGTLKELIAFIDDKILPNLNPEQKASFEKRYMISAPGFVSSGNRPLNSAREKVLGSPKEKGSENLSLVPKDHKYRKFFEELFAKDSSIAKYFCPLRETRSKYKDSDVGRS